ncbi:COMM domain containing 2 [Marchantia polymorpha subsp. ruderalis]|uniref:COMM domain-containing protein n=2 Tax=Marchantia polymorpha TaxID=3197 RepID=A0AAF6AN67_MARPO|nr:hypothetical protein MARPO_0036s0156 [Marchantia polymorpha]BBM97887.1 hypothetical protein Mp_1g09170 [Marchantia polymorpha subsp. ruderalis]|eukprot:PTQ41187.1 hypothetical protein MARPO_0036s0156 [Marchantia polymorpha]
MSRQRAALQPPPPLLSAVPPAVVHEFAKVAVTGLLKGETSSKGFTKAAKQLQTTVEAVSQAVSAVSNIYSRASRANLSYQQLVDFLAIQGYAEALRLALADYFIERVGEIREYVSLAVLQMPTYRSLDWRLDLQIASRSLRHQSAPVFVLSLTIQPPRIFQKTDKDDQGEETKVVFLEAKFATLKAVCSQLELAIGEARSGAHGQRVMRLFK